MAYKRIEHYDEEVTKGLMKNSRETLALIGENPDREGLLKTPERIAKALQYCTQGYGIDAQAILNSAKFHENISEMVIVKNIELYSLCEHHMLPFIGKCHVAYLPSDFVIDGGLFNTFKICQLRVFSIFGALNIFTLTPKQIK